MTEGGVMARSQTYLEAKYPVFEPPSKREILIEGIAMIIRENTRHPSGGAKMSPDTAREIAHYLYEYLQKAGLFGAAPLKAKQKIAELEVLIQSLQSKEVKP